ncbi:unnamed protein product, partial [Chrysoparadoxa australica]
MPELALIDERDRATALCESVMAGLASAQAGASAVRYAEAEAMHCDGSDTSEALPEDYPWVERGAEKAVEADKILLKEVLEVRSLGRVREAGIQEVLLGMARCEQLPPHPDQWMPQCERVRNGEEKERLERQHEDQLWLVE